jgi:hypothetical protein
MTTKFNLAGYQREMIRTAYNRCYGLQDFVNKDINNLFALADQVGIRLSYLKDHYSEIKEIN